MGRKRGTLEPNCCPTETRGHDVQVSVMHWPQVSPKVTSLAKQGIKVETYPRGGGPRSLISRIWTKFTLSNRRSYARMKQFKPDLVIISQGHNAGGFHWAKICREASIPYVLIVHCNSEHLWFEDWNVEEALTSYSSAQNVFCVSRGNLNLLRMQLGDPIRNGEVIWNPYNVSPESIQLGPLKMGSGSWHAWRAWIRQQKGKSCYCRSLLARNGGPGPSN